MSYSTSLDFDPLRRCTIRFVLRLGSQNRQHATPTFRKLNGPSSPVISESSSIQCCINVMISLYIILDTVSTKSEARIVSSVMCLPLWDHFYLWCFEVFPVPISTIDIIGGWQISFVVFLKRSESMVSWNLTVHDGAGDVILLRFSVRPPWKLVLLEVKLVTFLLSAIAWRWIFWGNRVTIGIVFRCPYFRSYGGTVVWI